MAFGWFLLTLGSLGVAMAAVLLVEKVRILEDPSYVPSCSINPILSCGSIMTTPQAEAFGFPNPIIGIAGFTVVASAGAGVIAGARFARWFWLALLAGSAAGVVFVHWLAFQSLYRIGALCPYCMVVWVVTIAVFWYTLLHVLEPVAAAGGSGGSRWYRRVGALHGVLLTAWYLSIAGLITVRFWDYWSTLA
ncbi:MAG: vitamin K epoxide reductase family protein [Ilumatobacter sp.]